jgi:hypothetical protein
MFSKIATLIIMSDIHSGEELDILPCISDNHYHPHLIILSELLIVELSCTRDCCQTSDNDNCYIGAGGGGGWLVGISHVISE